MPEIPTFTNTMAVPQNPGPPRADVQEFGQPWRVLEQGAAQVGDVMSEFNQRYQDARRQSDAANVMASASQQLGDAQFRWSKTADRDQAIAGFNDEAEQIKQKTMAGVTDPLSQQLVERQFDQEAVMRSLDTGNAAFGLESSARRGQLDTNLAQYAQSAATAGNDLLRAHILDNANMAIQGAVAARWLSPQEGADKTLQFKSQIAEVNARQDMNRDPALAANKLADPAAYPGLLPERREVLQYRAEMRADRIDREQIAAQAHADALAERQLRQAQSTNAAHLILQAHDGQLPDLATLSSMVDHQQISESGLTAALAAQREGPTDNNALVANLWAAYGRGEDISQRFHDAIDQRQISKGTIDSFARTLAEQSIHQADATEKGAFAQLKTALSGGAVEQGVISDPKAPEVAAWAQAQGEWNSRVVAKHEDPKAVLADMLPRYANNTTAPTWLPAPRLGAIRSFDDLNTIAAQTVQAFQTKAIDQATYDGQVELLNQYRAFYLRQQEAQTVATPKPGTIKKPAEGGQ